LKEPENLDLDAALRAPAARGLPDALGDLEPEGERPFEVVAFFPDVEEGGMRFVGLCKVTGRGRPPLLPPASFEAPRGRRFKGMKIALAIEPARMRGRDSSGVRAVERQLNRICAMIL
jgi:hypothetical protein